MEKRTFAMNFVTLEQAITEINRIDAALSNCQPHN